MRRFGTFRLASLLCLVWIAATQVRISNSAAQIAFQPDALRPTVRAARLGFPQIHLRDGFDLPIRYPAAVAHPFLSTLKDGRLVALSLAAADFDEDGVVDLASGYRVD